MNQPKSLLEFKRITHVFYTAYSMANAAMDRFAGNIESMERYDPNGLFQIGSGKDASGKRIAFAEMQNDQAVSSMRQNGGFSQLIAHGTISAIYSLWEEEYRTRIAKELGVNRDDLMCDVMGDIRLLRQFIVHKNGEADKRVRKLKQISWVKTGPLVLTQEDMSCIQDLINKMQVYIRQKDT